MRVFSLDSLERWIVQRDDSVARRLVNHSQRLGHDAACGIVLLAFLKTRALFGKSRGWTGVLTQMPSSLNRSAMC